MRSWVTMVPPSMVKNSVPFLQGLVSDTPHHHQTTHGVMASLRDPNDEEAHGKGQQLRKESSRSPDQLESTVTGRWTAIAGRDTSWEEPCDKKGKPSRFNCSLSVFYCIAGQVHQEPWQGQVSKDPMSTGDRWESLFPFREEWMVNRYCNRYNWHWEKPQYPDRRGYITEEEQFTSQAKVPWYTSNCT